MLNAYVYVRFSTLKQEKGASLERQLEDCSAYCARKGWPIVETLSDLGRSAWKGDHLKSGELGKFTARVHAGEIPPGSVLVVEKLDRLSRQEVRFTQRWLEDICAAGISIATVSGDRVYDDANLRGNLMYLLEVLLMGKLAHDESEIKSQRLGDSWRRKQAKAKAGVVMTTKTPGWLRVKNDRSGLETIPERVEIVKEVYEKAALGLGARGIARDLNKAAVPSWGDARKSGKLVGWTPGYITDLLRMPAVEGEYHPNYRPKKGNTTDAPILGYYPRVVDADLVARARVAMTARKGDGGRYRSNVSNLFAGLVCCSACGSKMVMRRSKVSRVGRVRYDSNYQCGNAYSGLVCDQKAYFNYSKFEPVALDAILHLTLDDRFFQRSASTVQLAIQIAEIEKTLALKRDAAKRLVKVLASMDDVPEIEDELRATRQEIRDAEEAQKVALEQLALAKGEVSPAEHLQRIVEVRQAIEHEDEETRIAARMKVHTALKAVVDKVWCNAADNFDGKSLRTLTVILSGGVMAVKFDTAGNLLAKVDASGILEAHTYEVHEGDRVVEVSTNPEAARRGITGGDPEHEARLGALLRRAKSN